MGRPESTRRIGCRFRGLGFKPFGRPLAELEQETLRLDELEALRLADLEGLYQEAAAERMGVSRATFARTLARARQKVAGALIHERLLIIGEGPVVEHAEEQIPCPIHQGRKRRGRGCRCRRGDGRRHHKSSQGG
ncbi:MAG: DUF134 domain-containing protein [bacterium]|nr:DUF134 domain-containing protein [bacterium]